MISSRLPRAAAVSVMVTRLHRRAPSPKERMPHSVDRWVARGPSFGTLRNQALGRLEGRVMAPLHPPARRAALAVSSLVAGLGLAVSSMGAASGAAAYLYVGGGGCSDTGTGTATVPFCTIAKAAKVAVAGQTVLVSSGTYTDEVYPWHSGTSGAPITFKPAPGASVVISGAKHGFTISNQSWISVSGFTLQNNP